MSTYELSTEREEHIALLSEKTIEQVRDTLYYDWPEWDEHIKWLQTASDDEIANWVAVVA